MDHFDFGKNTICAVVLDIGRTQLPDGSWLVDKIKQNLISRTKDADRPCLVFMSQCVDNIPKSISESTYQIDTFRQNTNDYPIIQQMKMAAKLLGECAEDVEKHFILITKKFNDQYADMFKWMCDQDYEIKIKIIGIGKETELLELVAEEANGSFDKVLKIDNLEPTIFKIGE